MDRQEMFPEWVATIAFYKALHLVEAVFIHNKEVSHRQTHDSRNKVLKETNIYKKINKHYSPLYRISLIARYMQADGQTEPSFTRYMPPKKVQNEVLGHHLHQVQVAARKFLSARAKALLE